MTKAEFNFIVVEGPIGVGKTSLAKRLAEHFGSGVLLEGAEDNPFLARFYRNPKQSALATQLFFLLQRAQQLNNLRQSDIFQPVQVADFLINKDRIFAELTLDKDELILYEQVYDHLTIEVPIPDLVIYLQAPVEVLLDRIEKRAIAYEQLIEASYLQRLADKYTKFFYDFDKTPLLIVNAAELNFVDNDEHFRLLLEQMNKIGSGRHYFNPQSLQL